MLGDDMVEIRNDRAEHPEAPKIVLARKGSRHAPHQEEPGNLGRGCPGCDTTFGFVIQQLFAMKSSNAILPERGGEFLPDGLPELASAQGARNAPPQKLAAQDRLRLPMSRTATRTDLRRPGGDEPVR
ncbi:hypothetical protein [Chelativorans intermedius]|uniref:Uncharacterized protein n=1 Tax=Chelativorans intermedius TaxID=515947 RepID=A0ABV6D7Z1_9HYPH|nr:hypothetical protein [Chelativorans intermedius]MCT8999885.1 hypothetical protein [Chelativorans intermedius]